MFMKLMNFNALIILVNLYINVFDDIYKVCYICTIWNCFFFFFNYVVVNEFEEISRMVGP